MTFTFREGVSVAACGALLIVTIADRSGRAESPTKTAIQLSLNVASTATNVESVNWAAMAQVSNLYSEALYDADAPLCIVATDLNSRSS